MIRRRRFIFTQRRGVDMSDWVIPAICFLLGILVDRVLL